MELNFNNTLLGNPSQAGSVCLLRNPLGKYVKLSTLFLGHKMNNEVEMEALLEGLNLAIFEGCKKLIIE